MGAAYVLGWVLPRMVLFLIRTTPAMILERAVLLTRVETAASTDEPLNQGLTLPRDVSAGVAAIRATDPAFDPSGLAGVAEAGYALVERSLISGDASAVRAVMCRVCGTFTVWFSGNGPVSECRPSPRRR